MGIVYPDPPKLLQAIDDFMVELNRLYAFYTDCEVSFQRALLTIVNIQKAELESSRSTDSDINSIEDLDTFHLSYVDGDPADPDTTVSLRTTQGEYKQRMGPTGLNTTLLGRYFIVLLYEFWETRHRKAIAHALGYAEADEYKEPLMGDLRLLRHDCLHNKGVLSANSAKKLEKITGMNADEEISFTGSDIHSFVQYFKKEFDALAFETVGVDPRHRRGMHIRDGLSFNKHDILLNIGLVYSIREQS